MSSNLTPEHRKTAVSGAVLQRAADKDDIARQVVEFCRADTTTGQTCDSRTSLEDLAIPLGHSKSSLIYTKRDMITALSRTRTMTLDYTQIITIDPGKRGGKPCIRGLRITVYDVLEYLASGMSEDDILADFPDLTREDIRACLAFAADRERRLVSLPPT